MQRLLWNVASWHYLTSSLYFPCFLAVPILGILTGWWPIAFNLWFAAAFTGYHIMTNALLYFHVRRWDQVCRCPGSIEAGDAGSHVPQLTRPCRAFDAADKSGLSWHVQVSNLWFSSLSTHLFWWSQAKACWIILSGLVVDRQTQFKTTIKSKVAASVSAEAATASSTANAKPRAKKSNMPAWCCSHSLPSMFNNSHAHHLRALLRCLLVLPSGLCGRGVNNRCHKAAFSAC